jgi:predicted metal-dependent hydrolase
MAPPREAGDVGEAGEVPANIAMARGVALYAAGRYWDAHEAWEAPWRVEGDPSRRTFLQGLIQAAAAMHKLLVMHDPRSAARLLSRALEKLAPYEDGYEAVALDAFRSAARACERAIAAVDTPEGAARFDRALVPPLVLVR